MQVGGVGKGTGRRASRWTLAQPSLDVNNQAVRRPARLTWVPTTTPTFYFAIFNCILLGPKLWEKPIQAKFNEDDFFVMNIDEFLAENNLQV